MSFVALDTLEELDGFFNRERSEELVPLDVPIVVHEEEVPVVVGSSSASRNQVMAIPAWLVWWSPALHLAS